MPLFGVCARVSVSRDHCARPHRLGFECCRVILIIFRSQRVPNVHIFAICAATPSPLLAEPVERVPLSNATTMWTLWTWKMIKMMIIHFVSVLFTIYSAT